MRTFLKPSPSSFALAQTRALFGFGACHALADFGRQPLDDIPCDRIVAKRRVARVGDRLGGFDVGGGGRQRLGCLRLRDRDSGNGQGEAGGGGGEREGECFHGRHC